MAHTPAHSDVKAYAPSPAGPDTAAEPALTDSDLASVSGGDFFSDAQALIDKVESEIQSAVSHVFERDQA